MSVNWEWSGARWWKFDFHTHTPASDDYGKGPDQDNCKKLHPRNWLLAYMLAGIDCVAITDHNNGAGIDLLKRALAELDRDQPDGYRPLHLFPGVEISVNGGVHVLALFGNDRSTEDIHSLLDRVGFNGKRGSSDDVTRNSLVDVVNAVADANGIAIPAHVDSSSGLFKLPGTTLQQVLKCDQIFAMEVVNPAFQKPQEYISQKSAWTEVLGSDAHHPSGAPGGRYPGSHFTWVKMGSPSLEGLRLALLDGALSVLRSDAAKGDPNAHAGMMIESIRVSNARYIGRKTTFDIPLNPWLNAVIGGRGTGKSTLVEFLRLVFRREGELPDALRSDFDEKYGKVYASREDGGLLTAETKISVQYRKNGARYRLQWSPDGSVDPILEQVGDAWVPAVGDIRQRFPVRIYSQKQIFHLAGDPLGLIGVINDAPEVGYDAWRRNIDAKGSQYLALRARTREIRAGLAEEPRIKGELADAIRKLSIFEQSGHAAILKELQRRRRQSSAISEWESGLKHVGEHLRETAASVVPDAIDPSSFDSNAPMDVELIALLQSVNTDAEQLCAEVAALAERADALVLNWQTQKAASAWQTAYEEAIHQYEALQERLGAEGITELGEYGGLVQRRQLLEQQVKQLDARKAEILQLESQAQSVLLEIEGLRRLITQTRIAFLERVLDGNAYVRISVVPFGARETAEGELRALLQRAGGGFDNDIKGLLGSIDWEGGAEPGLSSMKCQLRSIAEDPQHPDVSDRRFANHIGKLHPETLDRVDLWFPEDSLIVKYSPSADRQSFRDIREGSPGQKTAALLAFLLSYGDEPLILDQPEDDLDNHLIYSLIVAQLREAKRRRQVIVVTHNANIVVNGDAELVIALDARGGQTQVEASGSLQERDVRTTICDVMEGGEKAFTQRYQRIALEGRHVR